jgi:predicted RNase H-like nuclease
MEKDCYEEAIEIARELKKEGLSIDFIAKTTKIVVKKIKTL